MYMLKAFQFRSTKGICELCPTLSALQLEKEKLKQIQGVFHSLWILKCCLFSFHIFFPETNFENWSKSFGSTWHTWAFLVPRVLSVPSTGWEHPDCATNLVQTTGNLYHWHFHISEGEAVYPVGYLLIGSWNQFPKTFHCTFCTEAMKPGKVLPSPKAAKAMINMQWVWQWERNNCILISVFNTVNLCRWFLKKY